MAEVVRSIDVTTGVGEPSLGEPVAVDAEARVVESEPLVVGRREERSYARRFAVGYLIVGVLAVAAFAALGWTLVRATEAGPPAWSPQFTPVGSGLDRADSIAGYVASRYRLADGSQLVAVQADVPSYQDVPAAGFAIKEPQVGGNIEVFRAEGAIQYELCGLGTGCAIATGDPTPERERLVRREALELALYTFKYVKGVDRVATFLPPRAGSPPTWVLLFQRKDYGDQLRHPVALTLPDAVPPPEAIPADQANTIEALTGARRYRFEVQNTQGGQPIFVLEPAAA